MALHLLVGYSALFSVSAVYVFAMGALFADVSYQISKSRKQLIRILINSENQLDISNVVKLQECIERIGCRKIGFSCGGFYFVSYATVFKVRF